ncbi:MAG TPA: ATP-binding protein [Thermoanaerobaculia bacterium]
MIDLDELASRESEQIELKENVADIDDVVETLAAFANDLQNMGGGYVVCGAREEKDEHGFPRLVRIGLTAERLAEVLGTTQTRCRSLVSPPITPRFEELPADTPGRRLLVFLQPATGRAHTFRRKDHSGKYYVRVSRSTIEARNGVLRDLLVLRGELEPWDRRSCTEATVADLDLLALRDTLQRMGLFSEGRRVETYLSESEQLSAFVPTLCAREPLTGELRPRNFAELLFGRTPQRWIPGAVSIFSIYPGVDRSDIHAERQEIAGNLVEQARRLRELLDVQSYTAFDKSDPTLPNALKYPRRALYEALGNALAHRDYELPDPTRITVFADRIEISSPGSLPRGVAVEAFRQGHAPPKWRNQALAWFFNRLQLAQAEGQGIPTIIRVMREEGCPPPRFEVDETRVVCVLPAHPRHALLAELRRAEQALALGQFHEAQTQVRSVIDRDPLNYRALQLFAEIQRILRDPEPVAALARTHLDQLYNLPAAVLVQLAEALTAADAASEEERTLSQQILAMAARGHLEERELRRIVVAMMRARDPEAAITLVDRQIKEHPEWEHNPSLRQLRGDAFLDLAKLCRRTSQNRDLPPRTRQLARQQFESYLERAERDLQDALGASIDPGLTEIIRRNLDYLADLRRSSQRSRSVPAAGRRNDAGPDGR